MSDRIINKDGLYIDTSNTSISKYIDANDVYMDDEPIAIFLHKLKEHEKEFKKSPFIAQFTFNFKRLLTKFVSLVR